VKVPHSSCANRDDIISTTHSELDYLKIQLKAIEIQASSYMSVNDREDDLLREGIKRWKLDWKDVDTRFKARERRRSVEETRLGDTR
jgi:hypothetical protein